jgi:hypothetical protein
MRLWRCAPNVIVLIALSIFEVRSVAAQGPDFYTGRVRASDSCLHDLLEEGYRHSLTFVQVVAEIERSDGIVYVEQGGCGTSVVRGCLLHDIVVAGGTRFLRIHVNVRNNPRIALIARIAHELKHASEVLEMPQVRSTKTARSLFARIGLHLSGNDRVAETMAAQRTGESVLRELESAVSLRSNAKSICR